MGLGHLMRGFVLVAAVTLNLSCTSSVRRDFPNEVNSQEMEKHPYLVLVSIDGYRSDYTDLYLPPTLKNIRDHGAAAKNLIPVFPSKTYTNHYSIVTGLYAENHGIVANRFLDPMKNLEFRLSDKKQVNDGSWFGGVPVWIAAQQQGMLTATYFWPGSEADINGLHPSYYYDYDPKKTNEQRVQQVKDWLMLDSASRPHFITVYFSEVDYAGHHFGPESRQVKEAVLKVDCSIAEIKKAIDTFNLPINLIILSDHGMQKLEEDKVEYLDDYTNLDAARLEGDHILLSIHSDNAKTRERIYEDLERNGRHYKVFKREDMPAKYHYSKNARIGDIVVLPDAPYCVGLRSVPLKVSAGEHGYDPLLTKTMRGIFYALGPQIKSHLSIEPFENIHIYPFIMKVLGLNILSPIDGNADVLGPLHLPSK